MALILHIETSGNNCSVAVSNKEQLIACVEKNEGMRHAENLHPFIKQTLDTCNLSAKELQAVSVSAGPGSYTGLRIGVSAAKGICFAANIPLIAIDTLKILAASISDNQKNEHTLLCPMLDARRMEVYMALYDYQLKEMIPIQAKIFQENSYSFFPTNKKILFFGDGMPKCRNILENLPMAYFEENVYPSSRNMISLAYHKFIHSQFENTVNFEPLYLKEFFTLKKNNENT